MQISPITTTKTPQKPNTPEKKNSEKKPFTATSAFLNSAAGMGTAIPLSYVITTTDRALTQQANGSKPLGKALKDGMLACSKRPIHQWRLPEHRAVFGVYTLTYATKNVSSSFFDSLGIDSKLPAIAATTLVNTSTGIAKDLYLAKLFGQGVQFRGITVGLFVARDFFTVSATFGVAPIASQYLQTRFGMSQTATNFISQLTCPVLAQFFATPAYLLGLDFTNYHTTPFWERMGRVMAKLPSATPTRMVRQSVAFGMGSLVNTFLLEHFSGQRH